MKQLKLLFIALFLISCSGDDSQTTEEPDNPPMEGYRIKSINRIENLNGVFDDADSISVTYTGNRTSLISWFEEENNSLAKVAEQEFSYSGNTILEVVYAIENGAREEYRQIQREFQNDLIQETIVSNYESGVWVESSKIDYTYSGNSLTEIIGYRKDNGSNWQENSKSEFDYTNGKITEYRFYEPDNSEWILSEKEVLTYDGDMLESSLWESFLDLRVDIKREFSYSGNDLIHYDKYLWNGSDWTLTEYFDYTYESDNVWSNQIHTDINNNRTEDIYLRYEEGEGNAKNLLDYEYDVEYLLYPLPVIQ